MGFRTQSTIEKSVFGVFCRHVAADGVLRELGCMKAAASGRTFKVVNFEQTACAKRTEAAWRPRDARCGYPAFGSRLRVALSSRPLAAARILSTVPLSVRS